MIEDYQFWMTIPYFKRHEFTCKCGCGHNNISNELVESLNRARYIANTPFDINSATRCVKHNKNERGSDSSSHLKGLAVDISVKNSKERSKILSSLLMVGFTRIGVYKDFIHVDIDKTKTQNVIWYK